MCRKCDYCGTELQNKRSHARYCSDRCRMQDWRVRKRIENLPPEVKRLIEMLAAILPETARRVERLIALKRSQKPEDVVKVILYAHQETSAL